jgi:hypothetical protein
LFLSFTLPLASSYPSFASNYQDVGVKLPKFCIKNTQLIELKYPTNWVKVPTFGHHGAHFIASRTASASWLASFGASLQDFLAILIGILHV